MKVKLAFLFLISLGVLLLGARQRGDQVILSKGASSGGGAAAYVQQIQPVLDICSATTCAGSDLAFSSNVRATDGVVCLFMWTGVSTITSVVDGNSAAYSALGSIISYTPFNTAYFQYFVLANNAGGSGSTQLTLTFPTAATYVIPTCQEWSGVSTASGTGMVDAFSVLAGQTDPGTGTNAITSASVTTTGADGLAGLSIDSAIQSDSWSAGTSSVAWTLSTTTPSYGASEYFTQTSGASGTKATFTSTASISGPVTGIVALKP